MSFSGFGSCSVDGVVARILISHAGKDRPWAEWARWHLEAAGHPTELDSVDWAPGTNYVEAMDRALHRDNPLLVLLSSAYLDPQRFTADEWTARFAQRRKDPDAKLIPIRIENIDLYGGLWAPIVAPDLFDLPADQAVTVLVEAVRQVVTPAPPGALPAAPPAFPGQRTASAPAVEAGPRPPGSLPTVWNLARRNLGFTGRDGMLNGLHDALRGGSRVAVQALHGIGGVGKTQLALEYAHRFAGEYELAWWIPSEQPELISDHLSALALKLGLVSAGTASPEAVEMLQGHLRRHGRWLLIFDNAEDRDALARLLPDGPGHQLITSRNHHWTGVAQPIDVDVFSRAESVALVQSHLPQLKDDDADRLADALDDLPLAVGQAVDLIAETRLPVDAYLRNLATHTADLMGEGRPPGGYPVPLAASVALTAERLHAADPAAWQLLLLCARLGPEPIPADLFTTRPDLLPGPLRKVAAKPVAFARAVSKIGSYGLARLTETGPVLHRLVQAILRDTAPSPATNRTVVDRLLAAAVPDTPTDPRWWPRWQVLLPHIIAADPASSDSADLRFITDNAMWHLTARGEARDALPLTEQLHQAWIARHGPDDESVLAITHTLAEIHRTLGHYRQARDLNQENYERRLRRYGNRHVDVLNSTLSLAGNLRSMGHFDEARVLDEGALAGYRRIIGDNHPFTLNAAANLAVDLFELGEYERARQLIEDTLARQKRVLGPEHPETLAAAQSLTLVLQELGSPERARELATETWKSQRRVLGDNHPDSLMSAHNMAVHLHRAGDYEAAHHMNRENLTRRRQALGAEHPDTVESAYALAEDLDALGRHTEADEVRRGLPPEQDRPGYGAE
jgi:tetratricopeptide (TPR) repeat protein